MVFIYLHKKRPETEKRGKKKENQSLRGVQGVNWRAITKETRTTTHKEKEEVERQMD